MLTKSISTVPLTPSRTVSTPYSFVPGAAMSRSATSFCNSTTIQCGKNLSILVEHENQAARNIVRQIGYPSRSYLLGQAGKIKFRASACIKIGLSDYLNFSCKDQRNRNLFPVPKLWRLARPALRSIPPGRPLLRRHCRRSLDQRVRQFYSDEKLVYQEILSHPLFGRQSLFSEDSFYFGRF